MSFAHLFFGCSYSRRIWRNLVGGLMQESFTTDWNNLIALVSKPWLTPINICSQVYSTSRRTCYLVGKKCSEIWGEA